MRVFLSSDLGEVNSWIGDKLKEADLPFMGLIEPGVAVGFLCCSEGRICFLDGYATNPNASSEDRHKALEEITDTLINEARARGFKKIIALTKCRSLARRAEMHGLDLDMDVHFLSMEL